MTITFTDDIAGSGDFLLQRRGKKLWMYTIESNLVLTFNFGGDKIPPGSHTGGCRTTIDQSEFVMYYNFDYDWVHVEGDPPGKTLWLPTKHFEVSGPYTYDGTYYDITDQDAEIWELTYWRMGRGKKDAIGVGTGDTLFSGPITFSMTIAS